jgi:hypothetical protein
VREATGLASTIRCYAYPVVTTSVPKRLPSDRQLAVEAMTLYMRVENESRAARADWNKDRFRRLMRLRPRVVARLLRRWEILNPQPRIPLGTLRCRYHANLASHLSSKCIKLSILIRATFVCGKIEKDDTWYATMRKMTNWIGILILSLNSVRPRSIAGGPHKSFTEPISLCPFVGETVSLNVTLKSGSSYFTALRDGKRRAGIVWAEALDEAPLQGLDCGFEAVLSVKLLVNMVEVIAQCPHTNLKLARNFFCLLSGGQEDQNLSLLLSERRYRGQTVRFL